ncbi:aminotransferase class V-fold PLP-dependent enzyme [Oligoflexus sp.]|uniref:aminotransferase class V-fold PLP-dependent enzyme n=1 Tax=Oligoflexus sp. TaxID=1971216 RepID=UPI0039C9F3B0
MSFHDFPSSHAMRVKPFWTLDPAIIFLNHGSFGACPRVVLEAQSRLRARMESEPVRFFVRELETLHGEACAALALLIGAHVKDIASVSNATAGVNTVLRSIDLAPGDEVITTNHTYNACRNALDFATARAGARVVVADVPFPIASPDEVIEAILSHRSSRTRLVLIDHVTSQTGLIFPVERIVGELNRLGIDTLVDGAHAPGMVSLDLQTLGAAYYTGNCHKWMCAPKGAAFLYVRPDKQHSMRPLSISHGANSSRKDRSRFQLEFDWTGTTDPTPFLVLPEAIRFLSTLLPGGLKELAEHNRQMVLAGRHLLCQGLGCEPPAPESMIGSLATVPLPLAHDDTHSDSLLIDPLQNALFLKNGIEVPIFPFPALPQRVVRISAQIYNDPDDYRSLVQALGNHAETR